jgi:hypothetical protein
MRAALVLAACLLARVDLVAAAPEAAIEVARGAPVRVDRQVTARAPVPARTAAALFATGWRLSWDADTGVATALWGGFVDAPGAVASGLVAERAARAFLAAHLDLLAPGATVDDFVVASDTRDGALRTLGLAQRWRGIPVVGGAVGFTFRDDRLFVITSTALPDVRPAAAAPAIADDDLREAARRWVHDATATEVRAGSRGRRVVLPLIRAGAIAYQLAETVEVAAARGHQRWEVYLAADGTPLARASQLVHATGTLRFDVGVRSPLAARTAFPAPACAITVDGAPAVSDAAGAVSWPTAVATTLAVSPQGPQVRVHSVTGAPAATTVTLAPDGTATWSLAGDPLGDAQLSAFIHAGLAKERARRINPAVIPWLDQPLDVFVNEGEVCNASSDQTGLYFDLGDPTCENTGRLADVVYHEFGHSLHRASILSGVGAFDAALTEGLADFNAANLTGDPGIGRGFTFDAVAVRDLDPVGIERRWPQDLAGDPHVTGLIIGGALWDLRKQLIADLGAVDGVAVAERLFLGVMQRAADIPGAYLAALTIDDDDGNLGNGTPHACALRRAFGPHGLAPDYQPTTIGTPTVEGLAITLPITEPDLPGCQPPKVASVVADWRTPQASGRIVLTRGPGVFRGALPTPPDGTVVTFTITTTLDDGTAATLPDNPADPRYQAYVGPVTTLWCDPFDAEPTMWRATGLKGPEWGWAKPVAASNSGDPAAPFSGAYVYGMDVGNDGFYQPNQDAQTTSPAIDVRGYHEVRLQYRRWLTVQDATRDRATIEVDQVPLWTNASDAARTLDHVDREWRFHDVDLSSTLPRDWLSISWRLTSDEAGARGGWTLDDVCVVAVGPRDPLPCGSRDAPACPTAGGGGCATTDPDGLASLGLVPLALLTRRRRR